jgi:hypothetical protein
MYIIYSHNLATNEIIPRAKYATRKASRINLLKEAQQWLLNYKTSEGDWEIISHKFETKDKTSKFFIKRSDKSEDVLAIYENKEVVREGWVYNSTAKTLNKIMLFSIMEIPADTEFPEPTYITPTATKKEHELKEAINAKRDMIKEISVVLSKRRQNLIE